MRANFTPKEMDRVTNQILKELEWYEFPQFVYQLQSMEVGGGRGSENGYRSSPSAQSRKKWP